MKFDAIFASAIGITLALIAGFYAMLKMIFTNHTKIRVLETELNNMAAILQEVRDDQKELFKEIRSVRKT
tara:strand:- start:743 stop:952 length:210 start_codon:yes stop_codon:yes gene_type:complete